MLRSLFALIAVLAFASACKQRDPEAAGLVSEGTATQDLALSDTPAAAGAYTIKCRTDEPEVAQDLIIIAVRGAVSQTDEAQPLAVSVVRQRGNGAQSDKLADGEQGRGAVRPTGPLYVGFPSGVLTAEYAAPGPHVGLLTLAADPAVNGLPVSCMVTAE